MKLYSLSQVADEVLLRDLVALAAQDRVTIAAMLAHIAEVDARKLYLPAAFPSMFAYCVGELRFSEDAAYNRIRVARLARRFPMIFDAIAEGRLNLTSVLMLAAVIDDGNAAQLLAAAEYKSKSEVERLVADWAPRLDVPAEVRPLPTLHARPNAAPAVNGVHTVTTAQLVPERVAPKPTVAPLAPQKFVVQFTMDEVAHAKLRRVQELLSHAEPSGDVAAVMVRGLDALLEKLEKRVCAATEHPRRSRLSSRARHVPAQVRRAVWKRDRGQCTFVAESGHRCATRRYLELDHIEPLARGGEATVENLRLRCRAHNQYAAERTYGAGFMDEKRRAAASTRATHGAASAAIASGRHMVQTPTAPTYSSSSSIPRAARGNSRRTRSESSSSSSSTSMT